MSGALLPLVGRDGEYRAISDIMRRPRAPGLVIAGPAGVGRTRLAREALDVARSHGRPTRWAAGSAVTASVPFAALAHLLPAMDATTDQLTLLQRAARAIGSDGSSQPPVFAVDDVHLLDQLSVTLVHHLGVSGLATLVLTVRTQPTTPDPVTQLWKDGQLARFEVEGLTREDADQFCRLFLDGIVETRTGEQLWRLSCGNPMFLHELLDDGVRTGRLARLHGVWRWRGPMAPSRRLAGIVLEHVGPLGESEWAALRALAASEPLAEECVVQLSSPDAVTTLSRRGLIVDDGGSPGRVRTAHPLYSAVIREQTSRVTLRAIRRQVADGHVPPTSHEALRHRSAMLLDRDVPADAAQLTEAAQRANALLDHPLAEELARAGISSGGGSAAHLALVEATQWQGNLARSEQLAVEAQPSAAAEDTLAALAAVRAIGLSVGPGHADKASALLREAAEAVSDEAGRQLVTATEAMLAFLGGQPARAVQLGTDVMGRTGLDGPAEALAGAAAGAGLAVMGRTEQALRVVRGGWAALGRTQRGPEVAFLHLSLAQAEVLALAHAGRIGDLERRAAELLGQNLTSPPWAGDAVIAMFRGFAALFGGRPRVAVRWLSEARAGLSECDPTGHLPLCRCELAIAEVLSGDVVGARSTLAGRQEVAPDMPAVFRPVALLAQAWVCAGECRMAEAAALALQAAAEAAATEQRAVEALMLHAATRFDRAADVLDRLQQLARDVDSALVASCAAHIEAIAAVDGTRLDEVRADFEAMGAFMFAIDAAADAAAAHDRSGHRAAAAVSRATAAALTRRCDVTGLPGIAGAALSPLTAREEEVAAQAASGASNQAIAARLVLSVRTVETHLAHVYAKLGINDRRRLAEMLGIAPGIRG